MVDVATTMTDGEAEGRTPQIPAGAPPGGVGFLLRWAHVRAARNFNVALAPLGIEGKHFGVLSFLAEHPRSQRQLVDLTGSDKASMVRTIDELEARGFVRREPDPRDRRAYAVTLTPLGVQTLSLARTIAAEVSDALVAHMQPAHRGQLRELLAEFLYPGLHGDDEPPA
jgi:DNA-binding MarR family transcriptional regulator